MSILFFNADFLGLFLFLFMFFQRVEIAFYGFRSRYYLKWKGIYLWLPDKMEARPKTFDFTQEREVLSDAGLESRSRTQSTEIATHWMYFACNHFLTQVFLCRKKKVVHMNSSYDIIYKIFPSFDIFQGKSQSEHVFLPGLRTYQYEIFFTHKIPTQR